MTAEGDKVAVEADSQAELANGIPYANKYHFLVTLRDGLITGIDEYSCTYTVAHSLRQSGVSPIG